MGRGEGLCSPNLLFWDAGDRISLWGEASYLDIDLSGLGIPWACVHAVGLQLLREHGDPLSQLQNLVAEGAMFPHALPARVHKVLQHSPGGPRLRSHPAGPSALPEPQGRMAPRAPHPAKNMSGWSSLLHSARNLPQKDQLWFKVLISLSYFYGKYQVWVRVRAMGAHVRHGFGRKLLQPLGKTVRLYLLKPNTGTPMTQPFHSCV